VLQQIADALEVLPYQLFLEYPVDTDQIKMNTLIPDLVRINQQFTKEIMELIEKYK
jgi:hypothetical protein